MKLLAVNSGKYWQEYTLGTGDDVFSNKFSIAIKQVHYLIAEHNDPYLW